MTDQTPTSKKVEELYALIADTKVGMLTSRCIDGSLETRPMATQKRDPIADLWFVTSIDTHKVDDLKRDPDVNIGYLDSGSMEWVSVSGQVTLSQDRGEIRRLYQPDWKMWFGKEDDVRDGGPGDPRLVLLLVDVQKVHYQKAKHSKPGTLFELARGAITGKQPDLARAEDVDGSALRR